MVLQGVEDGDQDMDIVDTDAHLGEGCGTEKGGGVALGKGG